MAESSTTTTTTPINGGEASEDEKHIKSQEQFQAVVNFIIDNHHAIHEVKNFSKNFVLTPTDEADIDKMVTNEEPVFAIVYEILQRHHKNSTKHPSFKSIAEIFSKMGLQRLADDIEALWEAEEYQIQHQDKNDQ